MKKIVFGFLSASVAIGSASAQNVPVEKYRLPNGMTIILREDHTVPLATVNIWYSVGSKDEPPHHSGFAHLFEHLMFMGTFRVPTGQFDRTMEGGGGDNNASTAEDRTNYYDQGPSNLLPTLLWLESDRLQDLGAAMTQQKLNLQRDVVKNERRQNTENTPYGSAYEKVNGLMFPPGHPYHTSVIGSMQDLDNASVKDVQQFFATYYVPNNASMVVAGDFDRATIKHLIARYFDRLPRKPPVPRKPVPTLAPLGVKRLTLTDKVEQPKIIMTWRSPPAYKPGDAEIQLAASVLADGINSRLYQRLVVKDKLATSVSAFQESRLLGSVFYVDVTGVKGVDLAKLQAAIDNELGKFKANGPTHDELLRQSAKIESGTLNSLQSISNVADELNSYQFYLGEPNSFEKVLDQFRRATRSQVKRVAAHTLDFNNRAIITVLPTTASTGGAAERFAAKGDRLQIDHRPDSLGPQPGLGGAKTFSAPSPEAFKLSNGIPVYYWRRNTLPLMTVDLQFKSGQLIESAGKSGLASLTAQMLTQGAGKYDSQSYQSALDLLGASVGANVSRRRTSVSLDVLGRNFGPAVALMSEAVRHPKFTPTDFQRVKSVEISSLDQAQDDVETAASIVATREFFGEDSPYGRSTSGTPSSVGGLTLDDLRQEHSEAYQPSLAAFYVSGSLPIATVRSVLDREFGSWKTSSASSNPDLVTANVNPESDFRVFLVDKPGAVQTAIRFLMPAPTYSSPDRLALSEVGTILGGSFTSRLNQNLRESKGYTYGAGSSFSLDRNVGTLSAAAAVRADVTGPSLVEFLKEFDRISGGDISVAEAKKAAATIRTSQVNALDSIQGLVSNAASMASFGRPLSAITADQKTLGGISSSALNQLAKTAVPYRHGVLVLVGDKATILKQIQGLNLPEPKEVKVF